MNEIKFVGELQRVEMKPGDRYVIMCDQYLSLDHMEAIRDGWKRFVGDDGPEVLVLGKGFRIGVLGGSEEDKTGGAVASAD